MNANQDITLAKKESKKFDMLPDPAEFQMYLTIAQTAAKSGLYGGVGGEEKIFMVLLAARELGIKPLMALNGGIWNIKGRIEISPKLMSAMIRGGGHSIKVIKSTELECILEGKRRDNGDMVTVSFHMNDALRAGLAGKDVWKNYPKDMLYNRAMSRLGRLLFSDCIGGAYIQGETRDDKLEEAEIEEMAQENGYKQIEEKPKPDLKEKYKMIDQTKLDFIEHCKNTWKSKTEEEILDFFIANPNELVIRYNKWMEKCNAVVVSTPIVIDPIGCDPPKTKITVNNSIPNVEYLSISVEQPLPLPFPDLQQLSQSL